MNQYKTIMDYARKAVCRAAKPLIATGLASGLALYALTGCGQKPISTNFSDFLNSQQKISRTMKYEDKEAQLNGKGIAVFKDYKQHYRGDLEAVYDGNASLITFSNKRVKSIEKFPAIYVTYSTVNSCVHDNYLRIEILNKIESATDETPDKCMITRYSDLLIPIWKKEIQDPKKIKEWYDQIYTMVRNNSGLDVSKKELEQIVNMVNEAAEEMNK